MIGILILGAFIVAVAVITYRYPEVMMDIIALISPENIQAVYDWLSIHYGQIAMLVCIAAMFFFAFCKRHPMKFSIFALSLIITQVLGW